MAPSFIFSSFELMREDTTLVLAKGMEATLVTGLQEQGGKLDLRGEISCLPCCVFLRPLVFQINERRYNASIGEGHRIDLRDKATGTKGQMGPHGCQVEVPVLRLSSSPRPSN